MMVHGPASGTQGVRDAYTPGPLFRSSQRTVGTRRLDPRPRREGGYYYYDPHYSRLMALPGRVGPSHRSVPIPPPPLEHGRGVASTPCVVPPRSRIENRNWGHPSNFPHAGRVGSFSEMRSWWWTKQ